MTYATVTSGFRTVEDMNLIRGGLLNTQPYTQETRKVCCEDCMSENAKTSLHFLREKVSDDTLLSTIDTCPRCSSQKPVYDVPMLLLLCWYGVLEGDDYSKLLEKCGNVRIFDRAMAHIKTKGSA